MSKLFVLLFILIITVKKLVALIYLWIVQFLLEILILLKILKFKEIRFDLLALLFMCFNLLFSKKVLTKFALNH